MVSGALGLVEIDEIGRIDDASGAEMHKMVKPRKLSSMPVPFPDYICNR